MQGELFRISPGCTRPSTTEAEYMAAVEASRKIIWMKEFIGELGIQQEEFQLHSDNQSAIHHAKNVLYHLRTKHIRRRYHWVRERVEEKEFTLIKIHTAKNGLDILTNVLSTNKLNMCRQRVVLM